MLNNLLASHDAFKLLNDLGVVRNAFDDPYFNIVTRPIDKAWSEMGITNSMIGYSPISSEHYIAKGTALDALVSNGQLPRTNAEKKALVRAILAFTHDYLHNWAYRAVQSLLPEAKIDAIPVTVHNIDYFTSIHLLTEAVACVGLDYWLLSRLDLKTSYADWFDPLTTHYRERYAYEFKRYNPNFEVQNKQYFDEVFRLYLTDEIDGFDINDINSNAKLNEWLVCELLAARSQRANIRLWFCNLAGVIQQEADLCQTIDRCDPPFLNIVNEVGNLLWKMIYDNEWHDFPPLHRTGAWLYNPSINPDYRLWNVSQLPEPSEMKPGFSVTAEENFWAYVQQRLAQHVCPANHIESLMKDLEIIVAHCDLKRFRSFLSQLDAVAGKDKAPLELIILG